MRLPFAAVALFAFVAAAPAPDPLARQLLADSRAITEKSFGFERVEHLEASDGHKRETEVDVDRYDPAAKPSLTLVSVDGKPPTPKTSHDYWKNNEGRPVPNYGRVALLLAAARRVDATHYHVDEVPKTVMPGRGGMMARHLAADLTVDSSGARPFVSQTRLFAPEPFRMMLVAKIEKFEVINRYKPGADGRPRIVEQDFVLVGSGPGMSGTQITHATFRPL